jgi:hypothetical protein
MHVMLFDPCSEDEAHMIEVYRGPACSFRLRSSSLQWRGRRLEGLPLELLGSWQGSWKAKIHGSSRLALPKSSLAQV